MYTLAFKQSAVKEWRKLGSTVREQFTKKLAKILENPHIPSAALSGMTDCYKIKLRDADYRLAYQVHDKTVTVTVITVGKRDKGEVYGKADERL